MRVGVMIETKEFEKSWNAMRFAVTARKNGHEVKVWLWCILVERTKIVEKGILRSALQKANILLLAQFFS